jgi:hypothetical protein
VSSRTPAVAAGLAALFIAGCGGLVGVEGVVTVDGRPVDKGTLVFFAPLGDTRPAEALVQDEGRYRLRTGDQFGVMPGEYKVTISNAHNFVEMPWQASPDNPNDPLWLAYDRKLQALRNRPPAKGMLPWSYATLDTTPLRWKVPDDGRQADFAITTPPTTAKKP